MPVTSCALQQLLALLICFLHHPASALALPSIPNHLPLRANPHAASEPSHAYQHWRPYRDSTPWYVNFTWTNIFIMIFCFWGWCLSRCFLIRAEGKARIREQVRKSRERHPSKADDDASEDGQLEAGTRMPMTETTVPFASRGAPLPQRTVINNTAHESASGIDGTQEQDHGVDEATKNRVADQRRHAEAVRARETNIDEDGTMLQLMKPKAIQDEPVSSSSSSVPHEPNYLPPGENGEPAIVISVPDADLDCLPTDSMACSREPGLSNLGSDAIITKDETSEAREAHCVSDVHEDVDGEGPKRPSLGEFEKSQIRSALMEATK